MVQFETSAFSNNGKWVDYRGDFISIPLVCVLDRTGSKDIPATADLMMKSCNHTLVDSISIDYNNDNVIQQSDEKVLFNNDRSKGENTYQVVSAKVHIFSTIA